MLTVRARRIVVVLASLFLAGASCGEASELVSTARPSGQSANATATVGDITDDGLACDSPELSGFMVGAVYDFVDGGPGLVDNASPKSQLTGVLTGSKIGAANLDQALGSWAQRGRVTLDVPAGREAWDLSFDEALAALPDGATPSSVRLEVELVDPEGRLSGTLGVATFSLAENGWRLQGYAGCAELLSDGPFVSPEEEVEIRSRDPQSTGSVDPEQLWEVVREEAEGAERNADITDRRVAQWEEQGAVEASAESLGAVSDRLLSTAAALIPDARLFNTSAQQLEDHDGNPSKFQRFEFVADDGRYINSVWLETHQSWGFSLADAARGRDEYSVVDGVETLVSRYRVAVHIQAFDPTSQIMVSIVIEGGLGRPEALTGIDLSATEAALRDIASTRTE